MKSSGHDIPVFKMENQIASLALTQHQIDGGFIEIGREHAEKCCGLNPNTYLRMTDWNGQDWDIEVYSPGPLSDLTPLFLNGWDSFFTAHDVRADDLINIYKPIQPFNDRHFLVECPNVLLRKKITLTTENYFSNFEEEEDDDDNDEEEEEEDNDEEEEEEERVVKTRTFEDIYSKPDPVRGGGGGEEE